MADEQAENTPSQEAQSPDAPASEPTSEPTQEESSPGWWQRLFNRRPAPETQTETQESGEPDGASKTLTLTEDELQRRVQAETDRREAKRAADQRAQDRRKLRDDDPWAYAQQEREAEQQQQQSAGLTDFFATVGSQHDRISIDPLMEVLPPRERQRIMQLEGAGKGLDGRKLVVAEALKSLEKHWKAEGEKEAEGKLRRNQAFRKQILSEARGGTTEPDLLPASSGSAADKQMSDIFREYYGVGNRHNSAG